MNREKILAFRGERNGHDELKVEIVGIDDGQVEPLRHIRLHSPDGFEWGYGGSGPADLAVAILAVVVGAETAALDQEWHRLGGDTVNSKAYLVVSLCQRFKTDVVSQFAHQRWSLTLSAVEHWLDHAQPAWKQFSP